MFSYSKRLLFGDEAKLEFKRSNTHGIGRLSAERHIPASDHRYWAQYTGVFDTPGEAFSLLAVTDVRRALVSAPENIRTLVRNLSQHLFSLLQDPLFSPPSEHAQARGVGAFLPNLPGVGGAGSKMQDGRNRVKEALNCVRVLARVLPVILEGDHDSSSSSQADSGDFSGSLASDSFEKTLLWTRESTPREESGTGGQERPSVPARSDSESETQFVIDDEEEQDESNSRMGSRQNSKNKIGTTSGDPLSLGAEGGIAAEVDDEKTLPCLAERLITTTLDLLFYGGFTIPWTEEQLENGADVGERVHYAIWESGVGSSVDLGSTRAHEAHRVEVLRLLLVLLSKSIYIPAHAHSSTDNPALRFVAQRLDRAIVLPFLCSLLNTAARHSAPAGLLGLPYTSLVRERLVGNGEDTRDMLVTLCLQTLNVILGYDPPGQVHSQGAPPSIDGDSVRPILHTTASTASLTSIGTASGGARSSIAPANMFRFYVSKLHRHADFVFLTSGICAILAQPMNAASQLLPIPTTATGGVGADAYVPETLMLLWRLCDHNKKYRAFLLDSDRSPEILACLLFYALQFRDVPAQHGLVRLSIFILQDISADRAFGVHISKPSSGSKARMPAKWAVQGSATDLLVQGVYTLIATTRGSLSSMYPPLVLTLTNTAPVWRGLSVASATRLVQLLNSFSNPAFLLADEGNPRLVYYLLEAFTYVIHYHYASNANLIYALVRAHARIERLATFSLARGIADIRRTRGLAGAPPSNDGAAAGRTRRENDRAPSGEENSDRKEAIEPPASELSPSQDEKARHEAAELEAISKLSVQEQRSESPSDPAAAQNGHASAPSEKARGKMRETGSAPHSIDGGETVSLADTEPDLSPEELAAAAAAVGKNGFVASQEWVTSWQKGLPLDSIQVAMAELVPKVNELCATIASKPDADERVLALLREQTLVGVLPPAPPIHTRPLRWTDQAAIWLLSYLWGGIYVWSLLPLGVWAGTNARLFQLHIQQRRESRGEQAVAAATNAIGSAVGGVWQALGGGGASATGAQAQTNGPASPATGVPMRPLSRTPSSGSGIV